jgi:hypothetical protein
MDRCFACGRTLGNRPQLVRVQDEHTRVYVGRECAQLVLQAGAVGWQPPRGGPRLYALTEDERMRG